METYSKLIGCTRIGCTSFDGQHVVPVIVPNKCNSALKQEIIDFVLGELDDHDGFDALLKLWNINKIEDIHNSFQENKKMLGKEELKNQIMELAEQEVDAAYPGIDWSKMSELDCSNRRKEIREKAFEILLK